jgi:hypothetical protein
MDKVPTGTFRLKGPALRKLAEGKNHANPHQIHLAGGISYPSAIRYTDLVQSGRLKSIDLEVLYGILVDAAGLDGKALSKLKLTDVLEPVPSEGAAK